MGLWALLHTLSLLARSYALLFYLSSSQSELHRHQSELHDDTFDRELLLLEEEQLMESDEEDEALALFDSKTDDDLMLDMEEFI